MNDDGCRRFFAGDPANSVPAFGNYGLGPMKEKEAVYGGDIDAATAHGIAPIVMPIRGMDCIELGKVLRVGHL